MAWRLICDIEPWRSAALVDQIAPDEGQAGGDPLLITHVVGLEEIEQGVLLNIDAVVEKKPADQGVEANAQGIEKYYLCSNRPPEPSDVRWMTAIGVDAVRDELMVRMFFILHLRIKM